MEEYAPGLVCRLTLQGPLVHALQNGGHSEKGEGEIKIPVILEISHLSAAGVRFDHLLLTWDAQSSNVHTNQSWRGDEG